MTKPQFQYDLKSSLVVFLVALPLCLGIALASGAPLASGLVSGIIGGIVVGFLSDSHISVSGPAAGLTVIVASGITSAGSFEAFGAAIALAGIFQVVFSFLKGGSIGDFFPTAVIKGMLAAIGMILIIKQLPNALGLSTAPFSLTEIHQGVIFVTIVSLLILLGWEKGGSKGIGFFKFIPGPLVAVIISIIINQVFPLVPVDKMVKLPSSIFNNVNLKVFSNFNSSIVQLALTIAVVASLETLLCIDAADKLDPFKRRTDKNRELLAQGVGNTFSGFLGGLPLTAVIVRTSANVSAGARTRYSAILHGCWLLLCVIFIPHFLNLIPLATLASVLLLVGYKLTKPAFFIDMWKRGPAQLLIFSSTIIAILTTNLLSGIFIGVGVALIFELKKPALSCLEVIHEEDRIHFKFIKNVSFLHKSFISRHLKNLDDKKMIYIHGMKTVRVHIDVHELISEFHEEAKKKRVQVFFK